MATQYPDNFIGPQQPQVQPTPQGTPQGSLGGTMTGASQSGPTGPTLTPPPTPTANTGQSNQFALAQVMSALETKTQYSNKLMTQRNLLLKHLYDQPLTPDEQKQLDPTFLPAVQSNDRNQIDMSLRLISNEISGRTNTLDQSVQYLTTAYNQQIQNTETARQNAISNVESTLKDFITQYTAQGYSPQEAATAAGSYLTSLYGPAYTKQLQDMGIDINAMAGVFGGGGSPDGGGGTGNFSPGSAAAVGNPLGFRTSSGFIQYPDMQTGFQAGETAIAGVMQGTPTAPLSGSTWKSIGPNSTILDFSTAYKGTGNNNAQGWADSVAKLYGGGVTAQTKLSQLDPTKFTTAIANHESPGWNQTQSSTPTNTNQAPGTTGSPSIDSSTQGYATTPIARAGNLTQAAIDQAAMKYALTGTMPSIGLSSTGQGGLRKNAILNRAGELEGGANIEGNKVKLSALSTSLGKQTDYLNTMERSINTVDDNLQILQEGANKVNKSNSPLVNEWGNLVKTKVIGSGDLNAYKAAIQTVRTEYSNILARGGQVTDTARGEAAQLIPDNITKDQLDKVLGVLKAEGANVKKEAQAQVDSIANQINNIVAPQSKTSTPSTGASGGSYQDYLKSIGQ